MGVVQDRVVELIKIGDKVKGQRVVGVNKEDIRASLKGIFKNARKRQKG